MAGIGDSTLFPNSKMAIAAQLGQSRFYSGEATSVGSASAFTPTTFDPATIASVTLSSGNLVATNTGTTSQDQGAKGVASSGKTSGKYYFEMTYTAIPGGSNCGVGICSTVATYTLVGNNATGGNLTFRQSGTIYANGGNTGITLSASTAGTVINIAADLDNRKIWFRKTGSLWNNSGTADPATNVAGVIIPTGTMVPVTTFGNVSGVANNVVTANFGATAFVGAVPSGFTAGWPV